MRHLFSLFTFGFLLANISVCHGALVQVNGKWSDERYVPKYSVSEHFDLAKQLFQQEKWLEARNNFLVITLHFPESPFYGEALYYSGVCYFESGDYDMANRQFSTYLNHGTALQHFEMAFDYKYRIAEAFGEGSRKHLFGLEKMPKLFPAKKEAHEIYDEIIAAMPSKDLALKSLFSKAELFFRQREYEKSIETLTVLVRRFPKHVLAAESYLLISDIYLARAKLEPQNPDFISLAKVNIGKFRKNFPGDEERGQKVEANLVQMQEIYASTLYDVAQFYERKKKSKASLVYYNEAIKKYPETEGAKKSREKIANGKHLVAK